MTYNSVGLLGRGSSGVVELAVDSEGRQVATKRVALTGSAAQMRAAHQRLRREADVLSRLAHPGIVPLLDIVSDGSDLLLVFPAYPENLEDRVARLGPLGSEEVDRIGWTLVAALAAAHRHGVTHRDIKPANVLFNEAGEPALADFGTAVTWDVTAGLTEPGLVVGTPLWMSPEQARGEHPGPASDIYSLAATLLYAATGLTRQGLEDSRPAKSRTDRRLRSALAALDPQLTLPLARMLDQRPDRRPSAAGLLGGPDGTGSIAVVARRQAPLRAQLIPLGRGWAGLGRGLARLLGPPADRPPGRLRRGLLWTAVLALRSARRRGGRLGRQRAEIATRPAHGRQELRTRLVQPRRQGGERLRGPIGLRGRDQAGPRRFPRSQSGASLGQRHVHHPRGRELPQSLLGFATSHPHRATWQQPSNSPSGTARQR